MFEAALALPIFILFVLGMIELGIGIRSYFSASRALNIAAHKFASISAIDDWRRFNVLADEDLCLEVAGNDYTQQLLSAGGNLDAASSDPILGGGERFVLAGFPYQIDGGYPAPRAYELRASYRYSCLLCGVIGEGVIFRLSAVAILESTRGCGSAGRPPGMVAAYFPSLPPGDRVVSVPKGKVK